MDFLAIFAFLLVFIVIYALLAKQKVLGDNNAVALFVSLLMASFFVVQASLVNFIQQVSGWISVLVVIVFFLLLVVAFVPGDKNLWFLSGKSWFGWVSLGLVVGIFVLVSSYVFNWVVNWDLVSNWVSSTWFGWLLLVVIALIVSAIIARKVKP